MPPCSARSPAARATPAAIDGAVVRDVFSYVGLCRVIGDLFPIPVDVANRETLKPHIRLWAERDAVTAF